MILQEAQRNAITRQSNVIVSFDVNYNRFRVVQDYNNNDTINTADLVTMAQAGRGREVRDADLDGRGRRHDADGGLYGREPSHDWRPARSSSAATARRARTSSLYVTTRANVSTEYRRDRRHRRPRASDFYKWNGKGWLRMTQ